MVDSDMSLGRGPVSMITPIGIIGAGIRAGRGRVM
jgi:hypothetical protein